MIKDLIQKAKEENITIEVCTYVDSSTELEILDDKMENFSTDNCTSYKIKAKKGDKTITINTETIDIDRIINLINENIEISDNIDADCFADNNKIGNNIVENNKMNYTKIINELLSLNKLKQEFSELSSLVIQFWNNYYINEITNENVYMSDSNEFNGLYIQVVIKKDDKTETGSFIKYFKESELDINQIEKELRKTLDETIKSINYTSCKTNKYNILLDKESVKKILNSFSSMFFAEQIRKNNSILINSLGKKVFSDKLTIVEDPRNENFIGTRLFDSEGTATYYKEIVKDGVFKIKLYDNKSAALENTKSTGNSYGVRNLHILPGEKTYDELLTELNNGIEITNVEGLHAGVNYLNGQISLQARGWKISNGKRCEPLNMIILSTNLIEMFNSIKEIGNDLTFYGTECGAPSLLLENITISGKE